MDLYHLYGKNIEELEVVIREDGTVNFQDLVIEDSYLIIKYLGSGFSYYYAGKSGVWLNVEKEAFTNEAKTLLLLNGLY